MAVYSILLYLLVVQYSLLYNKECGVKINKIIIIKSYVTHEAPEVVVSDAPTSSIGGLQNRNGRHCPWCKTVPAAHVRHGSLVSPPRAQRLHLECI